MVIGAYEREDTEGRLPVSLCMIVRNESRFLADCLRTAAPYVAEMIVVDTGSTDDTIAIGERLGAQVMSFAWADDFAAARNASLAAARQPWILVLDADERLEVHSVEAWADLLADEASWGYFVALSSWVGGEDGAVVTDAVCRLFRNDERIRFRGVIHEEVATSIAEHGGDGAVGFADATATATMAAAAGISIWHEGYRDEVVAERDKFVRNQRLLELALARNPHDPVLRYAAGTELFAAGRYTEALEWLEPLASEQKDAADGYSSDVLLKIIHACRAVGRLADAARYAEVGVRRYGDFADMHDARAEVMLDLDDAGGALDSAWAAVSAGRAPAYYSTVAGAGTYRSFCLAGAALERKYQFEEAAEAYTSAIRERPNYVPAWQRLLLLGSLEPKLRVWWTRAAFAMRSYGDRAAVAALCTGKAFADMLCDLRLPEEAERLWSAVFSEAGVEPSVLVQGIWQAQRGDFVGAMRLWKLCAREGGGAAELANLYIAAVDAGALAAAVPTEATADSKMMDSAMARALLRLGAWPAWLRLHADHAPWAPPLLLAALQRDLPAALRGRLRAAANHRLAAGWTSAAGGSWRAAADDFAAAAADKAARPWQQRAAAAGLAAAFAAQARAAANAASIAGANLPALHSETALPLILGTAVLPPR
ncbi:glycosyl transferase family 2 [Paenibacillus taihuensis]|uniref:Glycosyl transferase family 2 n=1 Tax=Paenibacillus taihuensis TaxID=1156355 RepID=A0A3D9SCQ4_9BACL|nr:glycosyltransferase [Paenibacillus taihuensis]REE91372.1 glycosyl transferase family 2 [Paenibacillus taihuensis]